MMLRLTTLILILSQVIIAAPAEAPVKPFTLNPDLMHYRLENGLEVILSPRGGAELAGIQLFVRAGSMTEGPFLGSGISHLLEHLCFKGAGENPEAALARQVRNMGGYINAYTTFDHTSYFVTFPSSNLEEGLRIISDLVLRPEFTAEEVEREKAVVERERDMNADNPDRVLVNHFWANAYHECPVRLPVIGNRDLFRKITLQDVETYYRRLYVPQNMILVVTGDLPPAPGLKTWIQQYFGAPSPAFLPEPPVWSEPEPLQEVSRKFHFSPLANPQGITGWRTVPFDHGDVAALDVLSVMLGGMNSSLIRERLVQTGQLLSGSAWSYTPRFPGILGISFSWMDGEGASKLSALGDLVQELQDGAFDDDTLQKAIQALRLSLFQRIETVSGEARLLGADALLSGRPRYAEQWLRQVTAVTRSDVMRVGRTYLTPERRVSVLLTGPGTPDQPMKSLPDKDRARPELWNHESGLKVITLVDDSLPVVHLHWIQTGGTLSEEQDEAGIAALLGQTYGRESASLTESEVNALLDRCGGSRSGYAGRNTFGIQSHVLSDQLEQWLPVFLELCMNPAFRPGTVETAKSRAMAEVRKTMNTPVSRAALGLRHLIYGEDHPYGRLTQGDPDQIPQRTAEQIQGYFSRNFNLHRATLVLAGDVNPDFLVWHLSKWLPVDSPAAPPGPPFPEPLFQPENRVIPLDVEQTILMLGYPAVALTHPDREAFEFLGYYLSGQASPIFEKIREERGLAYATGASAGLQLHAGHFLIYAFVGAGQEDAALEQMDAVLATLIEQPMDPGEFQEVLNGFLGETLRARQSMQQVASRVALDTVLGLPFDDLWRRHEILSALTPESVQSVAQRHLKDQPRAIVILKRSLESTEADHGA